MNLIISAQYRHALDEVMLELQREADQSRRARGELPGIYANVVGGPSPDGRLTYHNVAEGVADRLAKRGIPFDMG